MRVWQRGTGRAVAHQIVSSVAVLALAAATARAQATTRMRIDPAAADPAATCGVAYGLEFDERVTLAQRATTRELFRARTELAALNAAVEELAEAQSGGAPSVILLRRGSGQNVPAAQVEQELSAARQVVDSVLRRVSRSRLDDQSVMVLEVNGRPGELQQVVSRINGLIGQISTEVFPAPRAPRGWIGVSLVGHYLPRYTRDGMAQLYCTDPIVETVEPGGPADKAGLARGDTLLTMNGNALKGREVRFAALMQPGSTITFRARRAGKTREVPVIVERRPTATGPIIAFGDSGSYAYSFTGEPGRARGATGSVTVSTGDRTVRVGAPTGAGAAVGTTVTITPWLSGSATSSATLFAGARFSTLSSDLADALGVSSGLLVSSVGPGSLAAEAGLREGDVVRTVNDVVLTSPQQLAEQVRRTRAVTMDVVRRGKTRTVELKW
ncbi:MAG: PDZ domain-containing protein [Gemmatimonadaceae bacterium]|jgi:hypothetical protein|nr:PDZ domain-containing protein [Gemmatimonadaceae bacterium]